MRQDILGLIQRDSPLFDEDVRAAENALRGEIEGSRFLVLGAAGSIGQSVTREIFKRNPIALDVVDLSENNLVELVRDLRSTVGYIDGSFRTFALDIGSSEFDAFVASGERYDYVLNLSALKHVRSEKDPFTLMRMVQVNIFNTQKTIMNAIDLGAKKYFCVSTDKAANPVNMMGASKRIMEMFLIRHSEDIAISTARFANVAFSDGSLLHGFDQRLLKNQPLVAPKDIRRYFVTPQESGELCLMSCIFGENRDIYFPKLSESLHLITFAEIAEKYLLQRGFTPFLCESEEQARQLSSTLPGKGQWPCLFVESDTTGEKDFEEFYTEDEILDMERFVNLGIVKNQAKFDVNVLDSFSNGIASLRERGQWTKKEVVELFGTLLPEFSHQETGKYLDGKM